MEATMTSKYSRAVEEFLGTGPLQLFIGGKWGPSISGDIFEAVDPGSGQFLARVYHAKSVDVDEAVQAAKRAFRQTGWATMKPNERGVYLHRLADLVEA